MWTKQTLCAYLAGHIDSDGSISISRNGAKAVTFRLRVSLYNNCYETLAFMQEHFGGTLHSRPPSQNRMAKHEQHTLVWQAKSGAAVLAQVVPYLRTKQERGKLALEFYRRNAEDGFNGHAEKSWQLDYYLRMRALTAEFYGGKVVPPVPRIKVGRGHAGYKLTEAQVRDIRTNGERGRIMANRYGVSESTISQIRKRHSWTHVI